MLDALQHVDKGANEYPFRVVLTSFMTPSGIQVNLRARLDESGLVIAGQDIGELVRKLFGDLDHEYWLTVGWGHVGQVEDLLRSELNEGLRPVLLELLTMAWGRGFFESDVDFREWLERHAIPFEFFSY